MDIIFLIQFVSWLMHAHLSSDSCLHQMQVVLSIDFTLALSCARVAD